MDNYYDRIRKSIEVGEEADYQQDLINLLVEVAEKDKRIAELEESRDGWKKDWRLLNAALLKAEERIKELEETIHNLRHPLSINPDEYVGDEMNKK